MLVQLKVGVRMTLPQFVADQARFSMETDHAAERLVAQLRSYVLAEHLVSETQDCTWTFPSSWWQHFKRDSWLGRHRPQWMRKRWPVRMTTTAKTITFDRYRTYPDARIALPEDRFGAPVMVEQAGPWYPAPS